MTTAVKIPAGEESARSDGPPLSQGDPLSDRQGERRPRRNSQKDATGKGRAAGEKKPTKKRAKSPPDDDAVTLQQEFEEEMRYRDTLLWSVDVLQQSVLELEKQLELIQKNEDEGESEFKFRFEAQEDLNRKLEEQIQWYTKEVDGAKERIKRGQEYSYDQDLDKYNEFELAKMVKLLERERNSLYSDLQNKSWYLDNHSKEYYHMKELIHAYTGDLTIVNRSLEHIWRQRSISQDSGFFGGTSPVTSPGAVKWSSGESGIRPYQRILDPRKGPVRKTVGVRSLPRLDQDALEAYDAVLTQERKTRSRSRGRRRSRAKSLETKTVARMSKGESPQDISSKNTGRSVGKSSSSGVFEDTSYEASNETSAAPSVELNSERSEDASAVRKETPNE